MTRILHCTTWQRKKLKDLNVNDPTQTNNRQKHRTLINNLISQTTIIKFNYHRDSNIITIQENITITLPIFIHNFYTRSSIITTQPQLKIHSSSLKLVHRHSRSQKYNLIVKMRIKIRHYLGMKVFKRSEVLNLFHIN